MSRPPILDEASSDRYLRLVDQIAETLLDKGYTALFYSFSALDRYCGLKPAPYQWLATDADLTGLSREFGDLRFPGPDIADAALDVAATDAGPRTYLFRCVGEGESISPFFDLLSFSWNASKKAYVDPSELYPIVRSLRDGKHRDLESPLWYQLRGDSMARGARQAARGGRGGAHPVAVPGCPRGNDR